MKAIILAGGFGTRLLSIIGQEIPKCMAPINGKPFIEYIINDMRKQGITDITLSLHYKADVVMRYFGDSVKYQVDDEPLGTGGAIKNSIEGDEPVLVVNGDTFAPINYIDMMFKKTYPLSIAITDNGESSGIYIMNPDILEDFNEKSFSFEKDVISKTSTAFYHIPWFIDIGTPEGYARAKSIIS